MTLDPHLPAQIIRAAMQTNPAVFLHLNTQARQIIAGELKTYEYFLSTLERLILSVYNGNLGGDFIGIVEDLILGQISQAYEQAWQDDGNELPVPEYLRDASQAMVLDQQQYVEPLYRDIVDARVDGAEPPLSRAVLWANQYTSAYNDAVTKIATESGGKLQWIFGDTDHCPECEALNGIVAYAREWEELDVHPQQPPNELITCGGWRCQCALIPTDQRRSPNAFNTIMNIVGR